MYSEAAIDNDFVMHLAEIDNWKQSELENVINTVFSETQVFPIMHELVYKHELDGGAESKYKSVALDFFAHGVMNIKRIDEFLDTEDKKIYYGYVFKEIYNDLKGCVPIDITDVLQEWKSSSSFGETHTAAMCVIIGCGIFLSDDNDSKELQGILKDKLAFDMKVYNRDEICGQIASSGKGIINKKTRNIIKHKPK